MGRDEAQASEKLSQLLSSCWKWVGVADIAVGVDGRSSWRDMGMKVQILLGHDLTCWDMRS